MTDADRGGEGETAAADHGDVVGATSASARPSSDERPVPEPPAPDYATGGARLAMLVLGTVGLGLWAGWSRLAIIAGLVVMIFLHELGHYVTAKWAGMKVTEFFIGVGPRIWSFRRGETEYGVKAIPVAAYVRIVGMNNLDDAEPVDEPRTYRQQSFPKQLLVVSAGSLMHFAQALVLLVVALGVLGVPGGSLVDPDTTPVAWSVGRVTPDSAAEAAGFQEDDEIVAVDGNAVPNFDDGSLSAALSSYDVDDDVTFTVERDDAERTLTASLRPRPQDIPGGETGSAFLGVAVGDVYPSDPVGVGEAVTRAPGELVRFAGQSLGALAGFFSPDGLSDFAQTVGNAGDDQAPASSGGGEATGEDGGSENRLISILGVVTMGAELSQSGLVLAVLLFVQINLFIGIFNMLPLPPMDGGHAIVAIYERIRSRRGRRYHADAAKLLPLTYAVLTGLLLLGVTTIYLDIVNPVNI